MNHPSRPATIFLTGFMCSGKSTIGRLLSAKTGLPFLELDHRIEQECRSSITDIFHEAGEDVFREIEAGVLRGLNTDETHIVSTGGGTPVFYDNMEWMKSKGVVIHLQCRPGVIFHRLAPEKSARPLVSGMNDTDLMGFIIDTLKSRLSYYNQAHIQVNAEKTPEEVVEEILKKLKPALTSS